jgi:hypothetical protein
MAEFAAFLPVAATAMTVVGSQQAGAAADRAAAFRAAQLEQQAGQERAASQRAAIEERRQAGLAMSAVQARAGGGGLDPTIVNLQSRLAGHGEYRALTALYQGSERAAGLEMQADAARMEGRQARRAGNLGAVTSVLSFAGSPAGKTLYDKIKGPKPPSSSDLGMASWYGWGDS